ncbi:MAG: hypothetical protein OR994_05320, partial [Candidatus Poseidoniales archaeon]|nr:hypothetical protein [Candidatus Poseidoniales archaeon]
HHILNESGWSYSNLMDISIIFLLTAVQYLIYANLLNFPEAASFGLALFWTMALRWHILVLE